MYSLRRCFAVVGDGNKVVLKSIQLGRDFGDTVEVKAGLSPQDRVIDSPPETLQTGDTVQIAVPTPSSAATQAGEPSYGIHGTPEPDKIGKTESHGCIRLTNWDALDLAGMVHKGTVVRFVDTDSNVAPLATK